MTLRGSNKGLAARTGGACFHVAGMSSRSSEGQRDFPSSIASSTADGRALVHTDRFEVPSEMNAIPHSRTTRMKFYDDLATVLCEHISDRISSSSSSSSSSSVDGLRISASTRIPELHLKQDVYRVGTLFELVRHLTEKLVADGRLRVRLLVQGPLGEDRGGAMPLALAASYRILTDMDWRDMEVVHHGDGPAGPEHLVRFGLIEGSHVADDDDVLVCIAPQSVPGGDITPKLEEVCAAAGAHRHVVLINPLLKDIPSANNVMSVRGRAERMAFARSFQPVYAFRLLYKKPYWHPIKGALRFDGTKWDLYKRVGTARKDEKYVVISTYTTEPSPKMITEAFMNYTG